MYYSAPAANILSVTVRGSDPDNETFVVRGPLGLAAPGDVKLAGRGGNDAFILSGLEGSVAGGDVKNVYIDAGSGSDQVTVDASAGLGPAVYVFDRATAVSADWDTQLSRSHSGVARPGVFAKGMEKYTLKTGSGADQVGIAYAPATLTDGFWLEAGGGADAVSVGRAGGTDGLGLVRTKVHVDGQAGAAELTYHNTAGAGGTYTLSDEPGWDARMALPTGAAVISKAVSKYTVEGSDAGADAVRVDAAPAAATAGVHLRGHGNSDTFVVGSAAAGLGDVRADVTATGGSGADLLRVDDRAGPAGQQYDVKAGKISRVGAATAIYNADTLFRRLESAAGGAWVRVFGNGPGAEAGLEVAAGPASDTVTVGAGGTLADVRGPVALAAGGAPAGGKDRAEFVDAGFAGNASYTLRPGDFRYAPPGTRKGSEPVVSHAGFADVLVAAGGGRSWVSVDGLAGDVAVAVEAGGGDDDVRLDGLGAGVRATVGGAGGYDRVYVGSGTVTDPLLTGVEGLVVTGGTVDVVTHGVLVDRYQQSAGTLTGPAAVTAARELTWTGGTQSGAGRTELLAGGTLAVTGPVVLTDRAVRNGGGGTLRGGVSGGGGRVENAGTLAGRDGVAAAVANPGTLAVAGAAVGTLAVTGPFVTSGRVEFDLTTAGTDRVTVIGAVAVGGALALNATADFAVAHGSPVVLIDNRSSGPVSGTFAGLPEGARLVVGRSRVRLTYRGDDGNDVALVYDNASPVTSPSNFVLPQTHPAAGTFPLAVPARLGLVGRHAWDPDGDPLAVVAVADPPGHGSLAWAADGGFTYTADPLFAGRDGFTCVAADGYGGQAVGTVAVAA